MATKRTQVCATLALLGTMGSASAAILDVEPFAQFSGVGHEVEIDLRMAFEFTTLGGAIDVFYDPSLLEFVGFDFDATFLSSVADIALSFVPENCFVSGSAFGGCSVGDGELNALTIGNFDGMFGIHDVGTFVFRTLAPGTATVSMAANDEPFEGEGFLDLTGGPIDVVYNSAQVYVTPIPAALWMMLSALGVMGSLRRRN